MSIDYSLKELKKLDDLGKIYNSVELILKDLDLISKNILVVVIIFKLV